MSDTNQTMDVLNISSRAFLEGCGRLQLDTHALLERAGLSREALYLPNGRIPLAKARTLWGLAYEMADDPGFALNVAQAVPFGAYQTLDFVVSNAPNLGLAMRKLVQYLPLINPVFAPKCYTQGHVDYFELNPLPNLPYAEFTMCVSYLHVQAAVGTDIPLLGVEFAYASPEHHVIHESVFQCPVTFGADKTRFWFESGMASMQSAHADASLFATLDQFARQRLMTQAQTSLVDEIRSVLRENLSGSSLTLQEVARALNMTPRTLQRRLKVYQMTFVQVLDQLREELAYVYLSQKQRSLIEISFELGFSDQSSFHRAFRRWNALTPAQWRQRCA